MDVVLRASAMFAVVFVLLRLMGKREIGQLTPLDFVTIVVMGDLIQQGITHNDFSLTGAALAISTFAFWTLVLGWAGFLYPPAEKLLEGQARILIRDGKVLREALRRDRLTYDEVESEMRMAGIGRLEDVHLAMLEPLGKISFIKKERGGEASRQQDDAAPA
jgi:uncharacterized membrane protein YcaP (DUF421 family)